MKKLFTKKDYLILSIILISCTILSFINLGSFTNPNTFIDINKNEEILVELKYKTYVNKIKLFTGNKASQVDILLSEDNTSYDKEVSIDTSAFAWYEEKLSKTVKYLRIIPNESTSLGEIALYDNSLNKILINKITLNNKKINVLTDEEETVPKQISYMNSSYFDEIYFARTAFEYSRGLRAYEWVHPPLGKLIQAIPLKITHIMAPFYYRLMGNIAGILMILLMYLFGKKLFKNTLYASFSSLLMAFDTFHFAQTRMGTVDSFLVLFIMLSFYFMYNYISGEKENRNLFLSGLFFGMATCTKWIGLYAGCALAVIFFTHIIKNKKINLKIILKGIAFFVIIPLILYIGCYFIYPNVEWFGDFSIKEVFDQAIRMFNYHANLKEGHFFSSMYYTWPLSYKPVWYYSSDISPNLHAGITGVGNIVIWWIGIGAFLYLLVKLFKKKDKNSFFILTSIIFTFLPFVFISRAMFLYHYFAILPFMMLAVSNLFFDISKRIKHNYLTYIYLAGVIIFFIIYYPAVSGIYMPNNYFQFIKIFSSWYF